MPLAGQYDWASVALVAVVAIVLLVIGVEAFVRRDIGPDDDASRRRACRARWSACAGLVTGPSARCCRRPSPGGWASGSSGCMIAGSGRAFIEQLGNSPQFMQMLNSIFPNVQFATDRRVPAIAVHRVRVGARRPRRGHAGRGMGIRRDIESARIPARDAPLTGWLGDRRWRRDPRGGRGDRRDVDDRHRARCAARR